MRRLFAFLPILICPLPSVFSLPPSTALLPEKSLLKTETSAQSSTYSTMTLLPSGGLGVDIPKQTPHAWDVQYFWRNAAPVKKGDVVLAQIEIQATRFPHETAAGSMELGLGTSAPPWKDLITYGVEIPSKPASFFIPCVIDADYPAGALRLRVNLGLLSQTVEILSVKWVNFGPDANIQELPSPDISYKGREPDAPWRKEAEERIEKIRKADLRVSVRNTEGRPLQDASVMVRQLQHSFGIGTCVVADRILGDKNNDEKYRSILKGNFNKAVFEHEMKWKWMEVWPQTRETAPKALAWLQENGFTVRGHNGIWPAVRFLPPSILPLMKEENKPELIRLTKERIFNVMDAYKGRVVEWDVVNEPVNNNDLLKILGKDAMVDWFRWAREADPQAKLYLNDYTMLSGGAASKELSDAFYENIRFLQEKGAPLDGVGEQAHFGWRLVEPERILRILDRFSTFGLPIQITEFDVSITNESLQADYTRDFLTAVFSHPSINGLVVWGFWAGQHWKPSAAMWDKDWQIKPNGRVWQELWFKKWFTEKVEGVTGDTGKFTARGFLGTYEITVSYKGSTVIRQVVLPSGGADISIEIPAAKTSRGDNS